MKTVSLVLLPGLDDTGDLFGPLINCLPDRIHPIIVSFPIRHLLHSAQLLDTL
ncbi:MAG: hypothetical protein ABII68_07175 [Pseudomonadota bacterium]